MRGATLWQMVKTGSSYASQSELPLTFGLGDAPYASGIRVTWPNGKIDASDDLVKANEVVTIQEGAGVVRTSEIERRTP